jgi:hypothetical protein
MRGSRLLTYFVVVLLGLACSASAAMARCFHVPAAVKKNGQYYHGVRCVNPNRAAGCRCSGYYCFGMGPPHYEDVSCVPLFTVPR